MNFKEAEVLEKEASKLIGKEIQLFKKNIKGEKEKIIFILKDIRGIGFETKIRNREIEYDPSSMFYHLSAVIEEKNGKEVIDVIPLKEVVDAIKNDAIINYDKW